MGARHRSTPPHPIPPNCACTPPALSWTSCSLPSAHWETTRTTRTNTRIHFASFIRPVWRRSLRTLCLVLEARECTIVRSSQCYSAVAATRGTSTVGICKCRPLAGHEMVRRTYRTDMVLCAGYPDHFLRGFDPTHRSMRDTPSSAGSMNPCSSRGHKWPSAVRTRYESTRWAIEP